MLSLQAQDMRAARLAIRVRSNGVTSSDVDVALKERALVRGWLWRGTLHLVRREDYAWMLGLTAPGQRASNRRRLRQEGVSEEKAERAVALIERWLTREGALVRSELVGRLAREGVPVERQAPHHLLKVAVLRGAAVLGPMKGGEQAFVSSRRWLGHHPPTELTGAARERALAELARRFVLAHGPARADDLAQWSGLGVGAATTGLGGAEDLVELEEGMWVAGGRDAAPTRLTPRLLGAFDSYLLAYKERGVVVPPDHTRMVQPGGGVLRPVMLVDGIVAGTWSARRQGGRLSIELAPFSVLEEETAEALRADVADVARFEALRPVLKAADSIGR